MDFLKTIKDFKIPLIQLSYSRISHKFLILKEIILEITYMLIWILNIQKWMNLLTIKINKIIINQIYQIIQLLMIIIANNTIIKDIKIINMDNKVNIRTIKVIILNKISNIIIRVIHQLKIIKDFRIKVFHLHRINKDFKIKVFHLHSINKDFRINNTNNKAHSKIRIIIHHNITKDSNKIKIINIKILTLTKIKDLVIINNLLINSNPFQICPMYKIHTLLNKIKQ